MGDRAIRNRRLSAAALPGALAVLVLLAFLTGLVAPGEARAWGFYAHRKTAEIAEANVSPATRAKIRRLMRSERLVGTPDCALSTIEDASVWPDCIRRDFARWGYTAAWHYRTAPICEAYDPRANCPGGSCVTGQIERAHRVLADESLPDNIRLEALAFMVHFAGDVHMPLHSGDKGDRGGNDREAAYGIKPGLNLHSIWDGPLAERAISDPADPVVRRYSPAERADLGGGTPADWGRESWRISRDFVYPTAFDTEDVCGSELPMETKLSQEDIARGVPIAKRRVQQAGIRIAQLLESAFAPGPLPPPERR
ncbi:S1/P1 nuclease [Erythrobacter sp. HL-111]|uniref:S1/P1 nuclease n=1 Tax=Erythrobacter sp. HL-111 TaxID=1798193 RepID=UPI0006D9ED35|nr:S1/P1 nuclease [Erythrobacter sp. HL-111]KPP94354.1 MAG: S1/P1 Nuclease [Erythrobacteraceae bacterium HL-111]SDS52278.1 S1/P1 Nuclease [Erythrobacter sp. HL-111]